MYDGEGAWFKKGSATVAGTARRVLRTTVPDPFLNQAGEGGSSKARESRSVFGFHVSVG